jgi:hypothetical protein
VSEIKGIRIQGLQKQLYLRSEKTSGRIFEKTIGLKIANCIVGSSVRLRKIRNWTLWRGWPPVKQKMSLLSALV